MTDRVKKLWTECAAPHRILWINLRRPAGSLWINCIFVSKRIPEKPLKTGLFFDIIGALPEKLSTSYPCYPHSVDAGPAIHSFPTGICGQVVDKQGVQKSDKKRRPRAAQRINGGSSDMDHVEIWDKAKALREERADVSYKTWIDQPLKPVYVADDKLAL